LSIFSVIILIDDIMIIMMASKASEANMAYSEDATNASTGGHGTAGVLAAGAVL
jgi:uncharacterized membrane protein